MLERDFQKQIIEDLRLRFEGCIILKNDATYIQGIPDLLILWNSKWAALECKISGSAKHQPNQEFYISKMNNMSYASFIYPENKEEVFDEMERALQAQR